MRCVSLNYLSVIRFLVLVSTLNLALAHGSQAGEVRVAVASNFTAAMKIISENFSKETGYKVINSFASSGKLYAQITHGAPFEIMLSANSLYPQRLVQEGLAISETSRTYAIGKLVLWSASDLNPAELKNKLEQNDFQHLAIANPKTAPYGAAAMQVIEQFVPANVITGKLVLGESISQTLQFVHSGAADLGFVSLSQIRALKKKGETPKSWIVPQHFYTPIEQQMVLLSKSENNSVAKAFYDYLQRQSARKVIKQLGYATSLDELVSQEGESL